MNISQEAVAKSFRNMSPKEQARWTAKHNLDIVNSFSKYLIDQPALYEASIAVQQSGHLITVFISGGDKKPVQITMQYSISDLFLVEDLRAEEVSDLYQKQKIMIEGCREIL